MIDLPTAKAHLRVDGSGEDALIGAYLAAAISAVEGATGKLLAPRVVSQVIGFPERDRPVRLWKGPVAAEPAPVIAYDDPDGSAQVLGDYRLVEGSVAQLLPAYGQSWPASALGAGAVRITYTAGYAEGGVPPALDQAVLLLTAHYYANREAVNSGASAAAVELPLGVEMLVRPYRVICLG